MLLIYNAAIKLKIISYKDMSLGMSCADRLLLTNDSVGDGDLQPHPVSDLQAGVRELHHLDDGSHVCFIGRQRQVF